MKYVVRSMIGFLVALFLLTPFQLSAYAAAKGSVKSVEITNLPAKTLTLKKGKSFNLKVKVTVSGKADRKVTYRSSKPKVVSVSSKGKLKALKNGSAKITIASKANRKKKVVIQVKVGTPVSKISLQTRSVSVEEGKTFTLEATLFPKDSTNKKIIWSSSAPEIASVSGNGVVTGVKAGTANVTALAQDGSGKKATAVITVTASAPAPAPAAPQTEPQTEKPVPPAPATEPATEPTTEPATEPTTEPITEAPEPVEVTAVKISEETLTLEEGEKFLLTAEVLPEEAADKMVIWSSSNNSVAVVNEGEVTAVSPGTTTITAEAGGKSAACTVSVIDLAAIFKLQDVTGSGVGDFSANYWGSDDLAIYYDKKGQKEVPKTLDVTYANGNKQQVTVEEGTDESGKPYYYFIASYSRWTYKYYVSYNDVRDCIALDTADESDSFRVDGDWIWVWTDNVYDYPQLEAKTTFEDREKDLLCVIDPTHQTDDEGVEHYGTVKVTIGDCQIEYVLILYYHALDENNEEIPLYDMYNFTAFSGDGLLFARYSDGYYEEYGAGSLDVYYDKLGASEPKAITAYRADGDPLQTTGQYSEAADCYTLRVEYGIWHYTFYVHYFDIFTGIEIWTGEDHLMDYSYEDKDPFMSISTVDDLPELWATEPVEGVTVQCSLSLAEYLDKDHRTLGVLTLTYGDCTRIVDEVSLNYAPGIDVLLAPIYIKGEGVVSEQSKPDWYDCSGQIELCMISDGLPDKLILTLPDGKDQEVTIFRDLVTGSPYVLIRKGIWTEPYYIHTSIYEESVLNGEFGMDEEYGSEISDVNAAYGTIEEIICDDECDELTGSISELTIDEAFEETEVQDVPENLYMTDNEVEIEESEYKAEDFSG